MFARTWYSGWRAGNVAQHSESSYKTHPVCCHQVLQILTKETAKHATFNDTQCLYHGVPSSIKIAFECVTE